MKPLCDRVLNNFGLPHAFGQKGTQVPEKTQFPEQVHGFAVHQFGSRSAETSIESSIRADAVWTREQGGLVGIVTADCVPILVSDRAGECVAAIHAGWRGLAAGVIEAGVRALPKDASELVAAVGPAARGCCYEIDEPVHSALNRSYGRSLGRFLSSSQPGHFQLDLPGLATEVLLELGIPGREIGVEHRLCTICNPTRFDSYRREGPAAGRLRHYIGTRTGRTSSG